MGERIVYVEAKFRGRTDLERVFGPKKHVARYRGMMVTDERARWLAQVEPPAHLLKKYQGFYTVAGGLYATISKTKRSTGWRLGIMVRDSDKPPAPRERFPTWKDAWAWVKQHYGTKKDRP